MRPECRFIVRFCLLCLVLVCAGVTRSQAAPYTLLHGFAGGTSDGANPQYGSLATDGTALYGFASTGGPSNKGVLFKINTDGSGYQIVHAFSGLAFSDVLLGGSGNPNDGATPYGTPLLIGSTLYGTTQFGGTNGTGSIFKINMDGSGFQLLHSFGAGFGPWDHFAPNCALVTDGTTLYGMTTVSQLGLGGIFSIGTNGTNYRDLHDFTTYPTDGANPKGGLLISGGTLYGMTLEGGANGLGTIFQMNTDGSGFQLVHSFSGSANDGASPFGSLILNGSTLYGTTGGGGGNNAGTVFSIDRSGANFQLVHRFSTAEGSQPMGDLTLSNATLFGMTSGTNSAASGTIFEVNTDGSGFQTAHTFRWSSPKNLTDGSKPIGSLVLVGSQLYGMTVAGGSSRNAGALFSFTAGLVDGALAGLQVDIQPSAAVKAGAQWQVDGGSFLKSGAVVTNLSPGTHTISFKSLKGWSTPEAQPVMIASGTTAVLPGTYVAVDAAKPTLKVSAPAAGLRVNNAVFTASGSAGDNAGVAEVLFQLNGGAWTEAATLNSWTNWSATGLTLSPGTNVFKAYARDLSGNVSVTNTVSFTYVVSAAIAVNTNGAGTIKPDLNGESLEIGKIFSMTAKAAKGYGFVNWTGSATTTSPKLTFAMASNLTFTANFTDIARPVNAILSPTKNQNVTSAAAIATGKAMDNAGVTAVWVKVNGGNWTQANLPNGTNWNTADLSASLQSGPNTISAYAVDAAGNKSLTNAIAFNYTVQAVADWAPDSLNGLAAFVTPANGSPELAGFDPAVFAQTSMGDSAAPEDFGGGAYTYLKVDTNLAQLSLHMTTPPVSSNSVGPIDLVFTNHYQAYFSNEAGGDAGGFALKIATNFVPASMVGKTLSATSSGSGKTVKIKLSTATTFSKTPANNSSSGSSPGTYAFTRLSPVCGMFAFAFTDLADAGQVAYVQITYTSAASGTYFVLSFDGFGNLQDVDAGQFTAN